MRRIQGLEEYAQELHAFVAENDLPPGWFREPDHIAIKCADELHYEDTVRVFIHTEEEIREVVMNNRKLATVRLAGSVTIGEVGEVQWLEIMEPRPERAGKDPVGIDHVEFFVPELEIVRHGLEQSKLKWKTEGNADHDWLTVVINERGQEVKFTGVRLGDIFQKNKDTGSSHPR